MFIKKWWADRINRSYAYAFFKDASFFTAVLVPFFTDWGHISLFQVQLLQSWFSLWVFILEVPTGAIADKIGRKYSLAIGSLIVAIAIVLYGLVPQFWSFMVAEFLFAVGYALASGADQALLYDTLIEMGREDESKKILGRAESFHLLGILVAAPIGGLIAAKYGLNAPQLASGIPFLIAACIGWSLQEPKVHARGSQSPRYSEIVRRGFRVIKHSAVIRTLAIDSVLVAASAYFVRWLYQPVLTSIHVPISVFGILFSLLLAAQIGVSSNFAFFEKFLGVGKKYLTSTALLVSASFIVAAIWPSFVTVIVLIIVGGGLGFTRSTYIESIANKHIDSQERATVLSSIQMIRRFTLAILNPVVGLVATLSLPAALIIVGILPLATIFIKEQAE